VVGAPISRGRLAESRSRRTTIKKYRSERKGRRSFDTAIEYGTVATIATEKTRTARSAVGTAAFQSGIGGTVIAQTFGPLKRVVAEPQAETMTLEVRSANAMAELVLQ
jgi:hypothetical protein